jgi:outer membrane protein assembly factor BamA
MGAMPPAKVVNEVKAQWHRGVFDKQRGDAGTDRLREWLMDDNYLQTKIEFEIQNVSDEERRVTFNIQPGTRSNKVVIAFEGASGIDSNMLDKIIEQQRLERKLYTDPLVVTELLQRSHRADRARGSGRGEVQRAERHGFRQ